MKRLFLRGRFDTPMSPDQIVDMVRRVLGPVTTGLYLAAYGDEPGIQSMAGLGHKGEAVKTTEEAFSEILDRIGDAMLVRFSKYDRSGDPDIDRAALAATREFLIPIIADVAAKVNL